MVDTPWLGMRLFGFFDDRLAGEVELQPGSKRYKSYPILGNLDDMIGFVQENQVHMVYLALPLRAEDRLRQVVEALRDTTASVYYRPGCLHLLSVDGRVHGFAGHSPHLPVGNPVFRHQRLGQTDRGPGPGQPDPVHRLAGHAVGRLGGEVIFAGTDNL